MEQNKALQILIEVALVAQAKGILTLEDAVLVKEAIDISKVHISPEEDDVQED
jgi:hypothetical protein